MTPLSAVQSRDMVPSTMSSDCLQDRCLPSARRLACCRHPIQKLCSLLIFCFLPPHPGSRSRPLRLLRHHWLSAPVELTWLARPFFLLPSSPPDLVLLLGLGHGSPRAGSRWIDGLQEEVMGHSIDIALARPFILEGDALSRRCYETLLEHLPSIEPTHTPSRSRL